MLCWFWGLSEYELELVVCYLMAFGLSKYADVFCFGTKQCTVEYSTGKIQDCHWSDNGTKPPKSKQIKQSLYYHCLIVMKALGFHIVFVESYNHLSPNVGIYMCQIRILLKILFQFNACSNWICRVFVDG